MREPGAGARVYKRHGKRVLDIIGSALALAAVAPLFSLIALAVRTSMGAPVFFSQRRAGLGGRTFTIVKFRTMVDARDERGNLLPDVDRLTPFGRFLRSTSLDELPELINVLKGEMSLVGPRPLLVEYLGRYSRQQARRHEVRPGITGLAQVNGRNTLTWEEKFDLDVAYIERCSATLDLRILLLTMGQVVTRSGIHQPGRATTDQFKGTTSS